MSFEREIKEFAKSLGSDLVGIVSSDSELLRDNNASIETILPDCRSLVVNCEASKWRCYIIEEH